MLMLVFIPEDHFPFSVFAKDVMFIHVMMVYKPELPFLALRTYQSSRYRNK